jgi:hypothetical protein
MSSNQLISSKIELMHSQRSQGSKVSRNCQDNEKELIATQELPINKKDLPSEILMNK